MKSITQRPHPSRKSIREPGVVNACVPTDGQIWDGFELVGSGILSDVALLPDMGSDPCLATQFFKPSFSNLR